MADPMLDAVRPLLRARQVREFLPDAVPDAVLHAITEAARWSGSSRNGQPWRFLVIRDRDRIRQLHAVGLPQTRSLATAPAVIAVVLPDDRHEGVSHAYDEGRAVERMLIAASMTGVAAGIAWVRADVRDAVKGILGLPADRFARTLLAVGTPTDAARAPKSRSGEARLPRHDVVFEETWPARP